LIEFIPFCYGTPNNKSLKHSVQNNRVYSKEKLNVSVTVDRHRAVAQY